MVGLVWVVAALAFFAVFGAATTVRRLYATAYWSATDELGYVLRSVGVHVGVGAVSLVGFGAVAVTDPGPAATAAVLTAATAVPAGLLVGEKVEMRLRTAVRSGMADAGRVTDGFDEPDDGDADGGQSDTPSVVLRVAYAVGEPIVTSDALRTVVHFGIGAVVAAPLGLAVFLDTPLLLVGWVAVAPLFGLLDTVSQSRSPVGDRPAPPEDAPNVLVCMVDDVRRDHVSLYGYDRETTPFLEASADEAVVFRNCVSAGLRSGHSIPSLLTGTYSSVHRYGANTDLRLLSDEFEDHGYTTAAISGNPHINQSRFGDRFDWFLYLHHGKEYLFRAQRLLARVLDWTGIRRLPLHYFRADVSFVNDLFASFATDRESDRPFFAYLNYIDVHHPYVRSESAVESFAADHGTDIDAAAEAAGTDRETQLQQWGYDETIRYTDRNLRDLYAFLDEEGLLDETLVFVTSDHGELLGERGIWGHIDIPYNPLFEVPLLAYTPSSSGETVDSVVSGAQFPSLVLSMAGLEPSPAMRAQWLTELTATEALADDPDDEFALVDFYEPAIDTKEYATDRTITGQRMLVGRDWKHYVNDGEAQFFAYDDVFMDDPVAPDDVPEGVRSAMERRMATLRAELGGSADGTDDPYAEFEDQRLRDQLEDLGYL